MTSHLLPSITRLLLVALSMQLLAACTSGDRMRRDLAALEARNQSDSLLTDSTLALSLADYFTTQQISLAIMIYDHNKLEKAAFFKDLMSQLGLKKDGRDFFNRIVNDAVQSVAFGHAHQGEKGVTYYTGSFSWDYPAVIELTEKLGILPIGIGGHIGYLMPKQIYYEWRLTKDDSEEHFLCVGKEIQTALHDYILPFMDKYSTITPFVEDVELGKFSRYALFPPELMPLALHCIGRKEEAVAYIEEKLRQYARKKKLAEEEASIASILSERSFEYQHLDRSALKFQDFANKYYSYLNASC